MIGLIDCNNFYASCERVFNPKLEGRPVGILSNNDGCVIARSNEIKPLVPMGMPAYQIPPHIRKEVTLLSSNYELYGDMSRRVFDTVREHTSDLEIYSIDEAFIHLLGFDNTVEYCKRLRSIVKRDTGIPVSIGLSSTKTLAKIANHVAKKNPELEGICWLHAGEPRLEALLKQLPVGEVWGIGYKIAQRLEALGIKTAWQLRQSNLKRIRQHFSVVLERTVLELQGTPCIELDDMNTPKQNIMTSRSFGKITSNFYDLSEAIRAHSSKGAEKLRSQQSVARALMVFLKTNRFRNDLLQYNPSKLAQLPYPTNDTRVIVKTAHEALCSIFREDYLYHKAGVMMLDLIDKDVEQFDFFHAAQDTKEQIKSDRLMSTIDSINKKMGKNTIIIGGRTVNATWSLKRDFLSRRYTTRWNELLSVKL
ncbi:Y-family DNA polymerase [Entomomonas moraniae]|uniref:Y-family DNA polymerase n=1 Tax=Entomomonas moraniae TaxID=2213226 RepID=A0A3Q9JKS8_9GAMM|nr:Y-family DNA polymerase [Entomomonas moraniae]AZS49807.1 Y-family DNA polymerase [Entomomonas moraniae]